MSRLTDQLSMTLLVLTVHKTPTPTQKKKIFLKIILIRCHNILFLCRNYNSLGLDVAYGKCLKISNTLFHTFLAQSLLFMQLFPKIPSEMPNSIDPDQTAPEAAV